MYSEVSLDVKEAKEGWRDPQLGKRLPWSQEDLSSVPTSHIRQLCMVTHTIISVLERQQLLGIIGRSAQPTQPLPSHSRDPVSERYLSLTSTQKCMQPHSSAHVFFKLTYTYTRDKGKVFARRVDMTHTHNAGMVVHSFLQFQHWGGSDRWISEFRVNLVYIQFQVSKSYTVRPCRKIKTK